MHYAESGGKTQVGWLAPGGGWQPGELPSGGDSG
jgi:hypothetical protein